MRSPRTMTRCAIRFLKSGARKLSTSFRVPSSTTTRRRIEFGSTPRPSPLKLRENSPQASNRRQKARILNWTRAFSSRTIVWLSVSGQRTSKVDSMSAWLTGASPLTPCEQGISSRRLGQTFGHEIALDLWRDLLGWCLVTEHDIRHPAMKLLGDFKRNFNKSAFP